MVVDLAMPRWCAGGGGGAGGWGVSAAEALRNKRAPAAAAPAAQHVVSTWCETDIFEAVGLHYVPPHMRHFHGVSS